jgi:hypothetical protein
MTSWRHVEPGPDLEPVYITMTEDEILDTFWDYWVSQMQRVGKLPMVTEANCIEDYVVVHWAEKVNP